MQKFWEAGWHTQLCLGDHLIHCTEKSSNCGDPPLPPVLEFLEGVGGAISIGVPAGWREFNNLNREAVIQAGSSELSRYLIVLRQDRSQLPQQLSLEQFGRAQIQQCLTRVKDGVLISGPEPLMGNRRDGHIYEMCADVANTPVRYLVTFFQCQSSFYSVFLWSSQEGFEKSRSEFLHILATFKVVTSVDSCDSTVVPM
ncbi:hypothetical protein ACJJIF_16175 [Microbulbifer sp. SSSA002]|uniref:hypothetical protein n=1 Tax=unclassified Microbulbifer TaxID=2619833 RepID=UPI00403938CB